MKKYTIILLCLIVSGCASRPDNIVAAHVPHERYAGNTCDQLIVDMDQAKNGLHAASESQNSKADFDAFGVFLLGLPFSQLSGDHQSDIATYKGKIIAIESAQAMKKCT